MYRKCSYLCLVLSTALVFGCPAEDDPPPIGNTDTGSPNLDIPDSGGPEDMGTDSGDELDSGMGQLELDCLPAWPTQRTVPRTEAGLTVNLSTFCSDVSADDLARATAHVTTGSGTVDAAVAATDGDGGALLLLEASLAEGAGASAQIAIETVELAVGESTATLSATGPRTHLAGEDLISTAQSLQANTISHGNPVFSAGSGPQTNPLSEGAMLQGGDGSTAAVWATYDATRGEVLLNLGSFDTGDANEIGSIALDGSTSLGLLSGTKADGGADVFMLSTCELVECNDYDIWFMHANMNEALDPASFESYMHSKVGTNGPVWSAGIDADLEVVPSVNGGANALTALWVTTDSALNSNHLVYAQAVAPTTGLPSEFEVAVTRAPENALESIATKIVNGKATVGIARNFKSKLDGAADSGLEGWASYGAVGGGTTFSRFALSGAEAFQPLDSITFPDIAPGTGAMEIVRWGATGRARLYAGLDVNNLPVAYVGEVLDTGSTGKTATIRLPKEARPDGRISFRAASNSGGTNVGLLGVVGGNTSEEDAEVPLDALLEGTEVMMLPAGGTIDPTIPVDPIAASVLHYSDSSPSSAVTFTPFGVATVAAVDPADCCGPAVANADSGTLSYDRIAGEPVFQVESGELQTFTTTPGYSFLLSKRASLFAGDGFAGFVPVVLDGGDTELMMFETDPAGTISGGPSLVRVTNGGETLAPTQAVVYGSSGAVFTGPSGDLIWAKLDGNTGEFGGNGTIATGLTDQSGSFNIGPMPSCPIHAPGCAVGAAGDPALNAEWSRQISLGGASVSREPVAVEPADAVLPAVMRVAARDAQDCPLETLLHVGGPAGEVYALEAASADCADLPIPVAAGDLMGNGGEQFLVAQSTTEGAQLTLYWVETAEDGVSVASLAMGEIPARIEVGTFDASGAISVADMNADGLPDLYINSKTTALAVTSGPFFENDGAGGFLSGGETSVPGLDVVGVGGPSDRPGGVLQSVNSNGLGTRKATVLVAPSHIDLL